MRAFVCFGMAACGVVFLAGCGAPLENQFLGKWTMDREAMQAQAINQATETPLKAAWQAAAAAALDVEVEIQPEGANKQTFSASPLNKEKTDSVTWKVSRGEDGELQMITEINGEQRTYRADFSEDGDRLSLIGPKPSFHLIRVKETE
ncbi:MAG: hypothetical protein N2C14_32530 [Planctomycetales bacterium]